MEKIRRLRCVECGAGYPYGEVATTCPACGDRGILDVEFDYDAIIAAGFTREALAARPEQTVWRYFELLPIEHRASVPSLNLGLTPIYDFPALAHDLGVGSLLIKDEGRQPTASFKDRASAVAVARAVEGGYREVACASTGNAASSLAGMAANTGLRAHIFVPATAPEAKVAQLLIFGADVLLVEGTYEDAYALCMEACAEFGWYNRNCAINPFLVEGKKTCGLEIGEQMQAAPPDWVAVSVGDGCTIAGIWKGLTEMHRLGVLPRLPRLLGVQAAGANPVSTAFTAGAADIVPQSATSIADSIAVGHPRNGIKALKAMRESHGVMIDVSDDDILRAMRTLASRTGVFGEPAGVAAFAGIATAARLGIIEPAARVLHVVTGNGLKDTAAAFKATGSPTRIPASLEAVKAAVAAGVAR